MNFETTPDSGKGEVVRNIAEEVERQRELGDRELFDAEDREVATKAEQAVRAFVGRYGLPARELFTQEAVRRIADGHELDEQDIRTAFRNVMLEEEQAA